MVWPFIVMQTDFPVTKTIELMGKLLVEDIQKSMLFLTM